MYSPLNTLDGSIIEIDFTRPLVTTSTIGEEPKPRALTLQSHLRIAIVVHVRIDAGDLGPNEVLFRAVSEPGDADSGVDAKFERFHNSYLRSIR